MKKTEFNEKLREYARTLSPTTKEQVLISAVYKSFNDLLGNGSCVQIGSYPRKTAITPMHDLDILYVVGDWHEDWSTDSFTPSEAITDLESRIKSGFKCPGACQVVSVDTQTHSVSVTMKGDGVEFSIDVVPAYTIGINEFNDPTYRVPEVIKKKSHSERINFYQQKNSAHQSVGWIDSDPRGYISVASEVGKNPDFRKVVKLVKQWKCNLEAENDKLKFKSFHIEQVVTEMFIKNQSLEPFDALFGFFVDMPDMVLVANRIEDRANPGVYIDDYIEKFTENQIAQINQTRDGFLIKLEEFDSNDSVDDLFSIDFRERKDVSEEYLFDQRIPVLLEPEYRDFDIGADITDKQGGFVRTLVRAGVIDSGRYLRFKRPPVDRCEYKWKVKNDDNSPQPRGEITDGHTLNVPENTKYVGRHYVECYAVRDGVCVAKARHDVAIQHGSSRVRIQR